MGAQSQVPEDQGAAETTDFKGTAGRVLGKELCPEEPQRLQDACWPV